MTTSKALVVVQSRFSSSRLRGKALYPLAGLPMVAFLIRRLKLSLPATSYKLVLATSDSEQDDAVACWGEAEGIAVVRGSEDDVLRRYIQCLNLYDCPVLVRVTADNPLTCPEVLEQMVERHGRESLDYLEPKNLPLGAGVDVFRAETMRVLDQYATGSEREHINLHILENSENFETGVMTFGGPLARPDLSMTIDTQDDWLRVAALFKSEEPEPWNISLEQAIARMDHTHLSRATA